MLALIMHLYSFTAFKTQHILILPSLTTIPIAKKIQTGHIQCTYHAAAYIENSSL